MFDLITSNAERPLRERSVSSKVVAVVTHVVLVTALVVIPILTATQVLPEVPTMMAFVAALPTAPPPPPPPPPPAATQQRSEAAPVKTAGQMAAPIEAPSEIAAERTIARDDDVRGALGGVEGGVEGGVVGGVVGGLVGAVVSPVPPPPPPPPPAGPPRPVRIGGQIITPAVVHRVEPIYPDIAAQAQLSGLVILEAVVDTEGCVESVKVLRSRHPLLDRAAVDALRQWRYSPLRLNDHPTAFILTVTFNFSVESARR